MPKNATYLGTLPNILGVIRILLYNRENARGDNAMSPTKIVINFCPNNQLMPCLQGSRRLNVGGASRPCSVSVIDCSSFSSSSVRVNALD